MKTTQLKDKVNSLLLLSKIADAASVFIAPEDKTVYNLYLKYNIEVTKADAGMQLLNQYGMYLIKDQLDSFNIDFNSYSDLDMYGNRKVTGSFNLTCKLK